MIYGGWFKIGEEGKWKFEIEVCNLFIFVYFRIYIICFDFFNVKFVYGNKWWNVFIDLVCNKINVMDDCFRLVKMMLLIGWIDNRLVENISEKCWFFNIV